MSPLRRSALAEAVSGALTPPEKPFGSLLIANPVSSPPPGMYVRATYNERERGEREGLENTTPSPFSPTS